MKVAKYQINVLYLSKQNETIMKFKGTKGEWVKGWNGGLTGPTTPNTSNPTVDRSRKYIPISNGKETVAIAIQQENECIKELEANAKLISCSPELLKMHIDDLDFLEKWLKSMENHNYDEVSAREIKDTITVKKDLIKKALGE